MKKLIACAAAAASLSCFADDKTALPIAGAGAVSCGTYTKAKEDKSLSATRMMVAWALGYATGVSVTRIQEGKPALRTVDANAVEGYLDKECKEHPLDHVYQAVMRLSTELEDAR